MSEEKGFGMSLFKWIHSFWFGQSTTTTTTEASPDVTDQTVTDQTTTKGSNSKRALCIGINNYPGSNNDLRGCVNDAKGWKGLFRSKGFDVIKYLPDSEATIKNVKNEMLRLVRISEPGDVLVFTYSGHGTTTADYNNDEVDGRDEAICLHDGLLIDDDIRSILDQIKDGVRVTFISDSCHSGTVTRAFLTAMDESDYSKARYMPPDNDVDAAALGTMPLKNGVFAPREGVSDDSMIDVLLSGCTSTEYSYDAYFNGQHMGAFSHHALNILKKNPRITYRDFYKQVRKNLPSRQYPQTPQLEGSEKNIDSFMFE